MIDALKALDDLNRVPGDVVAVTKSQMTLLLEELARRQPTRQDITFLRVAVPTPQPARAAA